YTTPSHTLLFFFLMLPPPPRSTLFPYTTLFRSMDSSSIHPRRYRSCRHRGRRKFHPAATEAALGVPASGCAQRYRTLRIHWDRRDRKSTRLNSSHRTISYAVFCLKKKKNRKQLM